MYSNKTIGLISDTHGLLRKEVIDAFRGVDFIIHAGDIGSEEIISRLAKIAPVKAVRGNCDRENWARKYQLTEILEIGHTCIYVLHDLAQLIIDPKTAGFGLVVFGHSHRPYEEKRDGVLFINPGSAGPKRFELPASVAVLTIQEKIMR